MRTLTSCIAALALLLGTAELLAQSVTASATVFAPLAVSTGNDLDFGVVIQGVAATVDPQADANAARVDVSGMPNAEVDVSWTLVTDLVGQDAGNAGQLLPISFTNRGCWNTGNAQGSCTLHDPDVTLTQRLDAAAGTLYLWLGGQVSPAALQAVGLYQETVSVTVSYTGN